MRRRRSHVYLGDRHDERRRLIIPPPDPLLELLEEAGPRLHALLFRLTLRQEVAEDLMQELFLRLRRSRSFSDAADPQRFAFRTAINLAMDWRRGQRHRRTLPLEPAAHVSGDPGPLARVVGAEERQRVLDLLALQPEPGRTVLVMRHLQGEAFDRIARAIGKTPPQSRMICYRALARLRAAFDDDTERTSTTESNHEPR